MKFGTLQGVFCSRWRRCSRRRRGWDLTAWSWTGARWTRRGARGRSGLGSARRSNSRPSERGWRYRRSRHIF